MNLEKFLSDFTWAGHWLAHSFADGRSTASQQGKTTLLEAPTGTLLFYYKHIKQDVVYTLLLEEHVCRRSAYSSWTGGRTQMRLRLQQKQVDLRLRPSSLLREEFRGGLEETAWKRRRIETSRTCDSYVTCDYVRCFR